jgi:uncharacterized repeat protein (TIGR01451 family)
VKRSPFFPFSTLLPALLLAAGLSSQAGAVGTTAGQVIQNQASATADPLNPGDPAIVVLSNLAEATVSPVCSVSVLPDGTVAAPGQNAVLLPGETATFSYQLVNTGNASNTFDLKVLVDLSSAFTPGAVNVYLDANGNGILDDAERAAAISSLTLNADAGATVFVVAGTVTSNRGDAFVNLLAACAGGDAANPVADSNNVARLQVGEPPAVTVTKTFTPALVKPGDTTTVSVVALNGGVGASRSLTLGDVLSTLNAQGLTYVAGSAAASTAGTAAGTTAVTPEFSGDGATYAAAEPAVVASIRATVPSLAPSQSLTLTFKMLAGPRAENKTLTNTATATTGTGPTAVTVEGSAQLTVKFQPGVALGPVGNASAPEGTPADAQTVPFAVVGQPVCFDHTLTNTGDVADNFSLAVSVTAGQATPALFGADGKPLAQPILLQPGQSVVVRVCYTATAAGPISATVTATGDRGETNATTDLVGDVQAGVPTLVKSVDNTGTVVAGDTLTYTLKVTNPYTRALTAALARDVLDANFVFVSAPAAGTTPAGSYDAATRTVTWTLGTLAPGETRTFTLVGRIANAATDGQTLLNNFSLTSTELPQPVVSNTVQNAIWSSQLVIIKTVDNQQAVYGDRLTYTLSIQNLSKTTAVTAATITDTLPVGLIYIAGTSTLGGTAYADPGVAGQVLTWSGLTLPAGGTIRVTYAVRVTPAATGDLVNTVIVKGKGGGDSATAIASNTAKAAVKVTPLNFAPLGEIIGYVYVDRNRDGKFQQDSDLPLPRARVILAGGRIALTDPDGRYHFANVLYGTQAVRLDPASVPYLPLKLPTEGALNGTQTVQVNGLTSVDFPLAPLYGDIQVLRRTVLTVGSLVAEKTVYVNGDVYGVRLRLTTPAALPGFTLQDPLPPGATLQGERPASPETLPAGETVLDYQFTFAGERGAAVTDPSASWRY